LFSFRYRSANAGHSLRNGETIKIAQSCAYIKANKKRKQAGCSRVSESSEKGEILSSETPDVYATRLSVLRHCCLRWLRPRFAPRPASIHIERESLEGFPGCLMHGMFGTARGGEGRGRASFPERARATRQGLIFSSRQVCLCPAHYCCSIYCPADCLIGITGSAPL
jgi:hypothetical protein